MNIIGYDFNTACTVNIAHIKYTVNYALPMTGYKCL